MRYIIYDLEATCWRGRPPKGVTEVIEIGAYMIDRYGEVIGTFDKFILPTVNPVLSGFCKELTSISQKDIDLADEYPVVIEEFKEWIGVDTEEYFLCSWGKFDKTILINNCHHHNIDDSWVDNHLNIKKQYGRLLNGGHEPGLRRTVEKEGFEFTGIQHRAIADAENLAKIFIKYIEEWEY